MSPDVLCVWASACGSQDVCDRDRTQANHVCHTPARLGVLTPFCLAAQLAGDLCELAETRRPQRMTHADQPPGSIDGTPAADL